MGIYTTGTGQQLNTHNLDECAGEYCCIHKPSDHHMKDWPTHWAGASVGMARVCKHGLAHPDPDAIAFRDMAAAKFGKTYDLSEPHVCDGCCDPAYPKRQAMVQAMAVANLKE